MQRLGELSVPAGDRDDGAKRHRREVATAVVSLLHCSRCGIRVCGDDDAVAGRDVQVAEEMALAESRQEQLFGVPAIGVAAEGPIGRTLERMLAAGGHNQLATVRPIVARSGAAVALPLGRDLVGML